jgi:hypothetical protein
MIDGEREKTCQRISHHLGTPHHQVLGHALVIHIYIYS